MARSEPRQQYTGEYKQNVVEDMRKNNLSQGETAKKYHISRSMIQRWERRYLEEGPDGLNIDRRRRGTVDSGVRKGRKPKLDKQIEEDLIAENQRLRAEVDYLKKLNALVSERVQREKKHRS